MYTHNASQVACSFSLGTSMICTEHRFAIFYDCMHVIFYKYCSIKLSKRRHVESTCLRIPGENTSNIESLKMPPFFMGKNAGGLRVWVQD